MMTFHAQHLPGTPTWYPYWLWMSTDDRKQSKAGCVWIQPTGNSD